MIAFDKIDRNASVRLVRLALPLRAFAILMIAGGCATAPPMESSEETSTKPPVGENSFSVPASAQTQSELGVWRWTSTVTDEKKTTFGYTASGEPAVGWQVVPVPAEMTEQKIAQTRFVLRFGTTGAAISITEEERPRMVENSFFERPDAMRVVELMLSDFGGQVPQRGDSAVSTDLGGSSLRAGMLKPLDDTPPGPQLVVETCSELLKRKCGAIDEQATQASYQIAPNCGGMGLNGTKVWSSILESFGIGHPCTTAHNKFVELEKQSKACRKPIVSGPACDCDGRTAESLKAPQCH